MFHRGKLKSGFRSEEVDVGMLALEERMGVPQLALGYHISASFGFSTVPEAGFLRGKQDLYWIIVLRLKSSSFGMYI